MRKISMQSILVYFIALILLGNNGVGDIRNYQAYLGIGKYLCYLEILIIFAIKFVFVFGHLGDAYFDFIF